MIETILIGYTGYEIATKVENKIILDTNGIATVHVEIKEKNEG